MITYPRRLQRTQIAGIGLLVAALLISAIVGGGAAHAAPAATTPDALRSVNISLFDTSDQFVGSTATQALVGAGHPAYVRMPFRGAIPDAYDLQALNAI